MFQICCLSFGLTWVFLFIPKSNYLVQKSSKIRSFLPQCSNFLTLPFIIIIAVLYIIIHESIPIYFFKKLWCLYVTPWFWNFIFFRYRAGFSIVLGIGFVSFLKFLLYVIFVDCIGVGLCIATIIWFVSNKFLLKANNMADSDVEWGYCFDVHLK